VVHSIEIWPQVGSCLFEKAEWLKALIIRAHYSYYSYEIIALLDLKVKGTKEIANEFI
jgi:hypothetical protein